VAYQLGVSYQPRGDQPAAIDQLCRGVFNGEPDQVLLGVTGSGKTFTMAKIIEASGRPALVLAHNKTLAAQLYHEFKTFFPSNAVEYFVSYYDYYQPEAYIPSGDVYIEKESTINDELDKLRLSATRSLFERRDCVIVASVSCIYGLGSPEAYYGMLLMLDRAGQIALPPVSYVRHNPLAKRVRPEPVRIDTTTIEDRLHNLQPLEFEQARRTSQEPLFNSLMEEHHYLGYEQPVGEHLKYLVWAQGRPVACLAWSSAPRHLGRRDRYIGWSAEALRRNIRFIAYNTRFLILPWVRVEHLASHILGRMAARISEDWQRMYGHPIYFLETFVDPERFRGTCYRAANWVVLGKTTGRGKQSNSYVPNRSIKEVLGYPLTKRFRALLTE